MFLECQTGNKYAEGFLLITQIEHLFFELPAGVGGIRIRMSMGELSEKSDFAFLEVTT